MATNLKSLAWKLQTALASKHGVNISITQYRVYSDKAKKSVTKYIVAKKEGDKYVNVLQSWSFPEVVKFLGAMWQEIEGTK